MTKILQHPWERKRGNGNIRPRGEGGASSDLRHLFQVVRAYCDLRRCPSHKKGTLPSSRKPLCSLPLVLDSKWMGNERGRVPHIPVLLHSLTLSRGSSFRLKLPAPTGLFYSHTDWLWMMWGRGKTVALACFPSIKFDMNMDIWKISSVNGYFNISFSSCRTTRMIVSTQSDLSCIDIDSETRDFEIEDGK